MRAEDAQGIPTQSHISPSILVYKGYRGGCEPLAKVVARGLPERGQVPLEVQHVVLPGRFNLRTTTWQKCEAVPRRARMSGS